ncbi:AMP-binding protein [Streptomyces xanthophaeus]|uniref:class I adenylate-forming enzyme family protein n=1 Tax=Streptomyces xanthophaeus TaxID=67385 RepID=UPI003862F127|nr:AMP-binding protein [Streptomyces xanthophaeus]WST59328.1 AMP-binding protein [Streptomyces xanthophaeus]
MWLTQLLERNRQGFGGRVALADARRSLTWEQLAGRVDLLAARLNARGVQRGDRVAVLSADRSEVVETYFALGHLGAVFVPLDPSLVPGEIEEIVDHAKVVGVIGEGALLERADRGATASSWRLAFEDPLFDDAGPGASAAAGRDGAGGGQPAFEPHVRADDPLAILYTSATGGRPKGVVVDHRSVKDISLGWLAATAPHPEGVLVTSGPLFHGTVVLAFAHLAAGAALVVAGPRPQDIVEAARTHRATHLWLVPETLRAVLDHLDADPGQTLPDSLAEVLYGAAPLTVELYARAARTLGCGFRQVYGLTEAGGPIVTLGPGEHPDPSAELPETLPTGRVIPGMSLRIADENGRPLPAGHTGEILVRGDGRMRGYWRDPAATAAATVTGWLRTGDLGRLDDEGRLHLVDRLTDLIIRNGRNVYPAEIERVLRRHPAVADAAVVPVADGEEGEVPLALVVLVPGATAGRTEILGHLVERMAQYKVPKDVQIIEELPRNSTGKVQKKLLTA